MQYKINGKDYELRFGIGFVRELNKVAGMESAGVSLGMSLAKAMPGLKSYDPSVLSEVIYSATKNKKNQGRPGLEDVDEALENDADLGKVFDDVQKELNESNAVKFATKNMKA